MTTAVVTVAVDIVNLEYSAEAGFGLAVRTVWAILRALGFLFLMRELRFGRLTARPFGLILTVTTVFASARLSQPRAGDLLPPWPVLAGLAVVTALCVAVLWQLFRSPEIDAHLTRRAPRRPVPPWVLTARVAALSYSALLFVPCLVALGSLFDEPRRPPETAVPLVVSWFVLSFAVGLVAGVISFVTLFGHAWARVLLALISIFVLIVQPVLCWLLLGADGVLRDGVPLVLAALLCLYGLTRSRSARE
ncbi:hypothetical protein ACFFX1_31730 [Dactylosporangium sucinum]|uniref:Uncharacterized protein n=1 Tax=Dactylosporangium sucinum TaxID=1424081 RepID=A0A917T9F8_9ACTN|nr:hypothetical protein [Dactylosporangium sucinum]GGM14225.1 hypothetical protein GCM10007977_014130 [Dactylosporangium sucinum]